MIGLGAWGGQAYAPAMRVVPRLALLLIALLAVGCASPKGKPVNPDNRQARPGEDQPGAAVPDWFPHAVDVRVHPASRYVMEDRDKDDAGQRELILEARLELLDAFGEPIKDVGKFVVELRLLDGDGQFVLDDRGRQRGFRWETDVSTKEAQGRHWDPIARAYVMYLKIGKADEDLPKFRTVLLVTFEPAWPGMPTLPTKERGRRPVEIRTDW